jgi:hypothetical protein
MSPGAERLPVGSRRIRYDPANPARISLAVGFDAVSFAAPLMLLEIAAVAPGTAAMLGLALGLAR